MIFLIIVGYFIIGLITSFMIFAILRNYSVSITKGEQLLVKLNVVFWPIIITLLILTYTGRILDELFMYIYEKIFNK